MSLTTPTTKQINENIIAQLEASLGQSIPILPKSFLRVLSKALAGVFILLYKYAGFMFLQIFVKSASDAPTLINGLSITPLTQWGRLIGVVDRVPASNAELIILVTTEAAISVLPSGSQLVNATNGVTYISLGAVNLPASSQVQVRVRAASDQQGGGGAGAIGNLQEFDVLTFANPLSNVNRSAEVQSQVITGADAETSDAYRQRVIDKFQKPPQGGAYSDYEIWGEEVSGIINVYPYTGAPGQVDLYSEATVASSGSADGIPTPAQLLVVLSSVTFNASGLANRRPANAFVNSRAISRTGFDVQVQGISVDGLGAVQEAITTAVTNYFLQREPFILGLSIPPRRDRITQGALISIVDSLVSASGGTFTIVTVTQNSNAVNTYELGIGEKAKLATIGFI